jgi:hypothetical protein
VALHGCLCPSETSVRAGLCAVANSSSYGAHHSVFGDGCLLQAENLEVEREELQQKVDCYEEARQVRAHCWKWGQLVLSHVVHQGVWLLFQASVMHLQAALDAMEAYYVKVKTEQRQLRERLDEVQASNQTLQIQLQAVLREHSQCARSK